jgi:hypothetical protein
MKEAEGNITEAADILQELQVGPYLTCFFDISQPMFRLRRLAPWTSVKRQISFWSK